MNHEQHKKLLYLHGFASSGASGTVAQQLRGFERVCINPFFGMSQTFAGGHRMNADLVHAVLFPYLDALDAL